MHFVRPETMASIGAIVIALTGALNQLAALWMPPPQAAPPPKGPTNIHILAPPAALLCFVWVMMLAGGGCAKGVTTIPNDISLAICVIDTYSTDSADGMTAAAITADLLAKCGGDAVAISRILDAHVTGAIKERILTPDYQYQEHSIKELLEHQSTLSPKQKRWFITPSPTRETEL